jgi:hypothetical protein
MFNMLRIVHFLIVSLLCVFITEPEWAQAQTGKSPEVQTEPTSVVGFVDKIKRQDDGRLLIIGWALDIHGNGAPVWVVAIYDGQIIFTGSTSGARSDVAKLYPQPISDNVAFSGLSVPIDCRAGQKVITLAVSPRHQFAILEPIAIDGCP